MKTEDMIAGREQIASWTFVADNARRICDIEEALLKAGFVKGGLEAPSIGFAAGNTRCGVVELLGGHVVAWERSLNERVAAEIIQVTVYDRSAPPATAKPKPRPQRKRTK